MRTITSESTYVDVDDMEVGRLLALLDVSSPEVVEMLDDLVHDCCETTASRRINATSGEEGEEGDAVLCDETSRIGSDVNNAGPDAQVAFLIAELGVAGARDRLGTPGR